MTGSDGKTVVTETKYDSQGKIVSKTVNGKRVDIAAAASPKEDLRAVRAAKAAKEREAKAAEAERRAANEAEAEKRAAKAAKAAEEKAAKAAEAKAAKAAEEEAAATRESNGNAAEQSPGSLQGVEPRAGLELIPVSSNSTVVKQAVERCQAISAQCASKQQQFVDTDFPASQVWLQQVDS